MRRWRTTKHENSHRNPKSLIFKPTSPYLPGTIDQGELPYLLEGMTSMCCSHAPTLTRV
jgi:hypothetical protein